MPIPVFQLNADETDAQLREQFINYIEGLLTYIAENNAEDGLGQLVPDDTLTTRMQAAWNETSPFFQAMRGTMGQISPSAVLLHGLYGDQLKFKLANVQFWSNQVSLAEQNQRLDNWIASINSLLTSINTLLDSILAALGAGSAAKEIKDAIRDAIRRF